MYVSGRMSRLIFDGIRLFVNCVQYITHSMGLKAVLSMFCVSDQKESPASAPSDSKQ